MGSNNKSSYMNTFLREFMVRRYFWRNIEDEKPNLKVGDADYQGYLVIANGQVYVADWTFDKYGSGPEFHVNGEYEPDVTYWTEIPSLYI